MLWAPRCPDHWSVASSSSFRLCHTVDLLQSLQKQAPPTPWALPSTLLYRCPLLQAAQPPPPEIPLAPRGQWVLCTQGHKALISSPDSGACVPAVCLGRPVPSGRHMLHLQPGDHHHAAPGVRLQKRSRWERHLVNCSVILPLLRAFLSFQAQLHTLHTGLTLQPRPSLHSLGMAPRAGSAFLEMPRRGC